MEEISALQIIFVCIACALAGVVDSIGGGGGLISLPAFLMSGLPVHTAMGTNKMGAMIGTGLATWRYARQGFIRWRTAGAFACFSLAGSALGARLNLLVSDETLRTVMLVVIPLTAIYVMRARSLSSDRPPLPPARELAVGSLIAAAIGLYDGFYGPGTGTFLILLLTGAAHMKLEEANGTTKVMNLASNVAAFAVMLSDGKVLIPIGLACGAFSAAGNWLGTRIFTSRGARIVRPIMIAVLTIFMAKIVYEIFF